MSLNPGTVQSCFLVESGRFLDIAPNIRFCHSALKTVRSSDQHSATQSYSVSEGVSPAGVWCLILYPTFIFKNMS
jgi:hypothetical protein